MGEGLALLEGLGVGRVFVEFVEVKVDALLERPIFLIPILFEGFLTTFLPNLNGILIEIPLEFLPFFLHCTKITNP